MEFNENCPQKRVFQRIIYGTDESQNFDIIIPKEKMAHAIVYIHGGAYLIGNKLQYPSFLLDYANNNIFATLDYRLINPDNNVQMADIIRDINDALNKIIQTAAVHNVTISDFILIGHSAGGHISLLYGYKNFYKNPKIKIAACVSLAGPTDFTDDLGWSSMSMWGKTLEERLLFLSVVGSRLTGHSMELTQKNWTKQKDYSKFEKYVMDISPVMCVNNKFGKVPPTLLVHGRDDDQVPYSNALRLNAVLNYMSVPNKLILTTGNEGNHMLGGDFLPDIEQVIFKDKIWVSEAREWIEMYLA